MLSRLVTILLTFLLIEATSSLAAPRIVISGAGPAALIFARRMLRLNKDVEIYMYEKRERPKRYKDITAECIAGDYAFGFGLNPRARAVLSKTPGVLEAVEAISQPASFGIVNVLLVNRRELCAELLYELEREFGKSNRLKIQFEKSLTDISADDRQVVTVTDANNKSQDVYFSLLVAGDGANSIVRSKMIERGYLKCQRYYSDVTWKALQLPKQSNLDTTMFHRYPSNKNHKFLKNDLGSILPRFKNRFVMLNFRAGPNDGPIQYAFDAKTPQELKSVIARIQPNVTNFPSDDVLQKFIEQPPGRESHMKLDRHAVEECNVVLMGDASVGMYSLLGQGVANAMRQADALAEILAPIFVGDKDEADVRAGLKQYSDASVIEGHAISDLNLLTHPLRTKFKLFFVLPMMFIGKKMTTKPEIPYSAILKTWRPFIWLSKLFWRRVRVPAPTVQKSS